MNTETLWELAKQCEQTARFVHNHVDLIDKGLITSADEDALQAILLRQETALIKVRQGQATVEDLRKAAQI